MFYIYTLSLKGRIFYVGCSADPVTRYKTHYHDSLSKCYDLIRYWLKEHDTTMVMNIIDCYDNKIHAFYKENMYIDKYNAIYPLLNNQHHPWLYTRAFVRIDKLITSGRIENEIQSVKNQIENYGK